MARVRRNSLISGLSGRMGQLVFRVIGKNTFVSPAPRKPDKRHETIAQRQTRITFRDASRWAKLELLDPEKKKVYQQKAKKWGVPNAYTAAIKVYMNREKEAQLSARMESMLAKISWAHSGSTGKPASPTEVSRTSDEGKVAGDLVRKSSNAVVDGLREKQEHRIAGGITPLSFRLACRSLHEGSRGVGGEYCRTGNIDLTRFQDVKELGTMDAVPIARGGERRLALRILYGSAAPRLPAFRS